METRTKIILGLASAGIATIIIYAVAKSKRAANQMSSVTPAPPPAPPVAVVNYNNKPIVGLSAFRDDAFAKPNMKDAVFQQRLQAQSDALKNQDALFAQRQGTGPSNVFDR